MKYLDSVPSTTVLVYSDIEQSRSEEAQQINLDTEDLTNLVRGRYRQLGSAFNFDYVTINVYSNRFEILLSSEQGNPTVDTHHLFEDYLDVDGDYGDINNMFNLADNLQLINFVATYYLNEDMTDITSNSHSLTADELDGFYQVESASIYISNIAIIHPVYASEISEGTTQITYSGYIDVNDGQDTETLDTVGMDHQVPISVVTLNSDISDDFSSSHPTFDWNVQPHTEQLNVNLLISLLDEQNSVDSSVSLQLGEEDNAQYDSIVTIIPPHGLGSISALSVISATFTSTSGEFSDLLMTVDVPDFDFLPLDIATTANQGLITYNGVDNNRVFISGTCTLDDQSYATQFVKNFDADHYRITLEGSLNTVLSFSAISQYIIPSISIGATNVLTTNELGQEVLSRFGITEENTQIMNVRIVIELSPFLFYTVRGNIQSQDSNENPYDLYANFVNLDGSILSYVDIGFEEYGPRQAFQTTFGTSNGDAGFQALNFGGFGLISVNRDFNTDKVSQLRDQNLVAFRDSGVILKDGVSAYLNAQLIDDCNGQTFCTLLKQREVPSEFSFTGYVNDTTVLTATMYDFSLSSAVEYSSVSLSLTVPMGGYVAASLAGTLATSVEPERDLTLPSTWTFGDSAQDYIRLSGTKRDVYQDVFTLEWLDVIQVSVTGQIVSNGTIINLNIAGAGLLGHNCYTRRELISELQTQDDPETPGPINYIDNDGVTEVGDHLDAVNPDCKLGTSYMLPVSEDLSRSYITGTFTFDNFEDLVSTFFTTSSRDSLPRLTNLVQFPLGLGLMTSYRSASRGDPVVLQGDMSFLGVDAAGQARIDSEEGTVDVTIYLPMFTVGGGGATFLSNDDLSSLYGVDRHHRHSQNFDFVADFDDIERRNVITTHIDSQSMSDSQLRLDTNVLVLGMVARIAQTIDEQAIVFGIRGRPFNGYFSAESTVQITPVASIRNEDTSVVEVVLDRNDHYREMEQEANRLFEEWMTRILRLSLEANHLLTEYTSQLNFLNERYIPDEQCRPEDYCLETPRLVCSEYAQQAVCVEEQEVCMAMTQRCTQERYECTRRDASGECVGTVAI